MRNKQKKYLKIYSVLKNKHKTIQIPSKSLTVNCFKYFFYVMASGGLYSLIYITNVQSLLNIFVHLDTTLRVLDT